MGMHQQLSTDSILLFLIITTVSHLRSIFRTISNVLHPNRRTVIIVPNNLFTSNLVLEDQLKMNRILSFKYSKSNNDDDDSSGTDCVVCLCKLHEGDQVRRLPCSHVFHKSCFDGWLNHLNFNCPLCRSTLVKECFKLPPLQHQSVDQSTN